MINWNVTEKDADTIAKIAQRAVAIDGTRKALDITMDITAVHCNGNPLRLAELLNADGFNFAHDYFGIRNCLDCKTGKLKGNFAPRYSA